MRGSGDPPSGRRLPNSGSLIERAVLFRPFVLPGICCRSLRWSTGPVLGSGEDRENAPALGHLNAFPRGRSCAVFGFFRHRLADQRPSGGCAARKRVLMRFRCMAVSAAASWSYVHWAHLTTSP